MCAVRRMVMLGAVLVGLLAVANPVEGQTFACPEGTSIGASNDGGVGPIEDRVVECVCPSGEVVGFAYSDGSFVEDPSDDGDCATSGPVVEEPPLEPPAPAPENTLVPLPPVQPGGRVLPRTG